ncbi:MAG: LTA synthase family protein [Xanthomonadales bacterium]|nr:LTA synthase family protein [Xanthomonadales bacterium]
MTGLPGWPLLALLLVVAASAWLLRDLVVQLDPALAGVPGEDGPDPDLPGRRWANALPLLVPALVLLALLRRPVLALWLTSLLAAGLYGIDALKSAHLGVHLVPADFQLLPQVLASSGLYLNYLRAEGPGWLAVLVLALATLALCFEPPRPWLRWPQRLACALAAAALLLALLRGWPPVAALYDSERLGFVAWVPDESTDRAGLLASLVKLGAQGPWRLPEADPVFVEHVVALHADEAPGAMVPDPATLPDIVVWQSESLFDLGRMAMPGAARHQPALADARRRSHHGKLRVPTYGGGTVRTEFEALTGYPLHAFPGIDYPYTALAHRPVRALPQVLRRIGYRTLAIHPYDARFWSRNRALPNLGFDDFRDAAWFDGGDYHGWYIGDDALLRHVVEALDGPEREDDAPRFVFAISMENHGPWHERPGIDSRRLAGIQVPEALAGAPATELAHYLYHARRADEALAALIDHVARRARPTVVLFYGDHLPALDEVFDQVGFADGARARSQPVPWLLFDNRTPRQRGRTAAGILRSYHLASLVLDAAGIQASPRQRVLSADRERHGQTGLASPALDPVLDYDHALAHLSWHYYRLAPDPATPGDGEPAAIPAPP